MKTLAIIIPIYNVEQYLLECLESLSAQSYGEFIAICVDDGSSDSSAQIITEYAKRDSRFILLAQDNQGIGAARNTGLRYVYDALPQVGYIGFMDPDDAVGVDYYANLIYALESNATQMATTRDVCRFLDSSYDSAMFALRQPRDKGIARKVTSKNIAHKIEAPRSVFTRALLQNLHFPTNRFAEDVGFSVCAHALASKVALSKSARYFYRVRSGSLTSTTHPPQEFFQVFGFVYEFFKRHGYLESYLLPTDLLRPNRFAKVDSSYLAQLQEFLHSLDLSPSVLEQNKPLRLALQAKSLDEFMARTRSFREWRADKFCLHLTKNRKTIILFGKRLLDTSMALTPPRPTSSPSHQASPRIAIIAKDITEAGGGERVGVNLANAFIECGFKVSVISLFSSNNVPIYPLESRAELLSLSLSHKSHTLAKHISQSPSNLKTKPLSKLAKLWQKLLRPLLAYKVERVLRAYKPTIVLSNDGWYIPRTKIKGVRYVRLWHLNAPKHLSTRKARNLAKFDTLVVLSQKELATWQSYHKCVRVIPNFLPHLPATFSDPSTKVVLSVGRLSGEKGFDRLLDIWAMVQDPSKEYYKETSQWQLHIVGSGKLREKLESTIAQKGLRKSVRLVGFRQDMESVYLGASVYAMCSYFEGFGMALAEACSYGLAGIAFDIAAGPSDIITQGKSGYLIENGDKESFATRLCELMSDETKRAEFGTNARGLMAQNFSKQAVMPQWQEMLR